MTIDLVFIVLLLGHVLGDFYFNPEPQKTNSQSNLSASRKHALSYAICLALVLWVSIPSSTGLLKLYLSAYISHFAVDIFVALCKAVWNQFSKWIQENDLLIRQIIHVICLWVCWYCFGDSLQVRSFVSAEIQHLPALPVTMTLAVFLILKPVSLIMESGSLKKYRPATSPLPNDPQYDSGKMIGYLERLIVFGLLLYGEFGAIAFVLTIKSIARAKSIEGDPNFAEYYLIGTLMSVGAAFVITVLLGLCNAAK